MSSIQSKSNSSHCNLCKLLQRTVIGNSEAIHVPTSLQHADDVGSKRTSKSLVLLSLASLVFVKKDRCKKAEEPQKPASCDSEWTQLMGPARLLTTQHTSQQPMLLRSLSSCFLTCMKQVPSVLKRFWLLPKNIFIYFKAEARLAMRTGWATARACGRASRWAWQHSQCCQ